MSLDLKYGTIRPQYVGMPIEDIKATTEALGMEYKTNKQNADQLEIMMANLELLEKDNPNKYKAIEKLKGTVKGVVENNNWEDASNVVSQATKDFATDKMLKGSLQSKAIRDKSVADLDEAVKSKRITEDMKNSAIAMSDAGYNGVTLDANGNVTNLYSPETAPDYFDHIAVLDALGKDFGTEEEPITWNENGMPVQGFIKNGQLMKNVGNGYLAVGSIKNIKKEDLQGFFETVLKNDPKAQAYYQFQNKVNNFKQYGTPYLNKVDLNKVIAVDMNGRKFTNANKLAAEWQQQLVSSYPYQYKMAPDGETLLQVKRDVNGAPVMQKKENGQEEFVFEVLQGGDNQSIAASLYDQNRLLGLSTDIEQMRTMGTINGFAGAFAEKYDMSEIKLEYKEDHVYLETLKANLQDRNNKRQHDRENPNEGGMTFSEIVSGGNYDMSKTMDELLDEIDKLKNSPGANTTERKKAIATLQQAVLQQNYIESFAKNVQLNKAIPGFNDKLFADIKNNDTKAVAVIHSIFGQAEGDEIIKNINNGTLNEEAVNQSIGGFVFNNVDKIRQLGYISGNDADALNNDDYFGRDNIAKQNASFGEKFTAYRNFDFSQPKTIADWYEENGNSMTTTYQNTTFFNKKANDFYQANLREALNLGGVITYNGKTYSSINEALSDMDNFGTGIAFDPATGEIRDAQGKIVGNTTLSTYGDGKTGEGIAINLSGGQKILVGVQGTTNFQQNAITNTFEEDKENIRYNRTWNENYTKCGVITSINGVENENKGNYARNGNQVVEHDFADFTRNAAQLTKYNTQVNNPKSNSATYSNNGKQATLHKTVTNSGTFYSVTYKSGGDTVTLGVPDSKAGIAVIHNSIK